MTATALILPGIGDSDPGHWQSLWQESPPRFVRVEQRDWRRPVCAQWVETLEHAVKSEGGDCVLVAHSLGCLLVAHWAAQTSLGVRGALLVAPPDPGSAVFPPQIEGFSQVPMAPLAFPSIVVASSDDAYGDLSFTAACARAWGSRFVEIGPAGHINTVRGFGPWPEGLALFRHLATIPTTE